MKSPSILRTGLLTSALLALLIALPAQAARIALVVGNAAYSDGPLKNPVNDARAVQAKLTRLGFEVMQVENLKRRDIGRTVNSFASRIRPGDEVVVFYAGHGVQVKGINYLPAVDADIQSEEDVPLNSLNLGNLLERLDEAKAGVKILLLDACRNNPYARSFRSGTRGLARMQDAPSGTLMHFATRPGSVAADGTGSNGLYTTELLRHIDQPGMPIEQMLKQVSAAVDKASKGQQEPWTEGSLRGDFYFQPGAGAQVASVEPVPTTGAEQEVWELAKRRDTAQSYQAYLGAYPNGHYATAAQVALKGLQPPAPPATQPRVAGQTFTDCADCPEMMVVRAGSFLMGSPTGEGEANEKPQRLVSLPPFAIGKYEVTQGQWKAVMGVNPSRFSNCGDNCPVEQVSWNDVQQFTQKLSQKTGSTYRLPSEAEWEYACRAGGEDAYCGSSNLDSIAWYQRNSSLQTRPTGQKQANAFGMYDMTGNVTEWTQDCYDDKGKAPNDGQPYEQAECSHRVMRGGSWSDDPSRTRAAFRFGFPPGNHIIMTGFRVARKLP